jgi:hypothetical protein
MDEQEWMGRIDEHMARGNEIMARNEQAFVDLQSYLREATVMLGTMAAEVRATRLDTLQELADQRKESRVWREESRVWREESRAWREESRAWRKEQREESRAFLDALFSILDRLNRQPPPSPA